MKLHIDVRGRKKAHKKLNQVADDVSNSGDPMVKATRESALMVTRNAKSNLVGYQDSYVGGVDTGRLRASITPEVRIAGNTIYGVVGTNVFYGPFVEYDTRPHWPPLKALEVWARRHGTTAYLVARAISIRGTRGKHYLEKGLDEARTWIRKRFERAVKRSVDK
jgi:hypothetical protein